MKTKTMKAACVEAYGGPEQIQIKNIAIPKAHRGEVLVKVHASSATTADSMIRTGKPYFGRLILGLLKPKYPVSGTGFSGEVIALGESVHNFKLGDQVFGETTLNFGTNAEYLSIKEAGVILPKPESLSHEEAAVFCDGPLTSYNFLVSLARIKAGQKVLINGAAGSLGSAAVQIANYYGAEVTALASTENFSKLKELGAHHCVDYKTTAIENLSERFDIFYDTVGKSSFKQAKKVLSKEGQYYSPVLNLSTLVDMICTKLFKAKQRAHFAATGMLKDPELKVMLEKVLQIQIAAKLKVPIFRQYPLEKVAEAHRLLASGTKKFNLVIRNL